MKKEIIAYIVFVLIVSVGLVVAAKNQEQKQDKEFELPDNTIEVAPGVFYFVVTTTTSAEGIVQTTPILTDEGGDDVIVQTTHILTDEGGDDVIVQTTHIRTKAVTPPKSHPGDTTPTLTDEGGDDIIVQTILTDEGGDDITAVTGAKGIVQTTPTLTDEGGDDVIEEPSPEQELNDNDEPHDNEGIEQHLF